MQIESSTKPAPSVAEPVAPRASAPASERDSTQLPEAPDRASVPAEPVAEIGGRRDGPEPTRYGDWEKAGRCIDF